MQRPRPPKYVIAFFIAVLAVAALAAWDQARFVGKPITVLLRASPSEGWESPTLSSTLLSEIPKGTTIEAAREALIGEGWKCFEEDVGDEWPVICRAWFRPPVFSEYFIFCSDDMLIVRFKVTGGAITDTLAGRGMTCL